MEEELSEFAAREPSLGYFYQIRYSLYLLLSNRENQNAILRIENLDDIEIETLNKSQVFQTKHKLKSKANLTNSCVDFWKTIRVWADNIRNNRLDLNNTIFNLISTEKISKSSFIYHLKQNNRTESDVKSILSEMDKIATSSTNLVNLNAYSEYLKLTLKQKNLLIKNINIIDSECDIIQISKKLKAELALSAPPNQIESFLEILEGWWFQITIEHLLNKNDGISFQDLQYKISDIRDTYSIDNLPNHFNEQLEISDEDALNSKDKNFLKQLELISIKISSDTAKRAISDFRRAFEQRSKWLRLELISPFEESKYEEKLYDHWKNLFDILKDECLDQAGHSILENAKLFYLNSFIKNSPNIRIRDKFKYDYLTRGSFQILADNKRIGWHPNYLELI